MNRSETALLLGAIAGRDRRIVGDADVLAWHEDVGDLGFEEARAAVSRHFRESTEYLMPAHIRRHVRVIRDENRRAAEIRELPSRFEDDDDRNARIQRNIAQIRADLAEMAARMSIPDEPQPEELTRSDEIRLRALDRARAERQARTDEAS
jgi:hypothetical protein